MEVRSGKLSVWTICTGIYMRFISEFDLQDLDGGTLAKWRRREIL